MNSVPDERPVRRFKRPVKQITDAVSLERFEKSIVRSEIIGFLELVSDVMKAPSARHPSRKTSTAVKQTIDFLETVASHLGERVDNLILKKRYGDPTFRVWYSQLDTETSGIKQTAAFFNT